MVRVEVDVMEPVSVVEASVALPMVVLAKVQVDAPPRLPVPVRVNVPPTRVMVPSPVASPPLTVMLCGPLFWKVVPEPTARSLLILISEPNVVVPEPEVVKLYKVEVAAPLSATVPVPE